MIGTIEKSGNSPDAIRDAVSRVLSSDSFANSKRLRRFLAHVTERALAGEESEIKEYSLALAVFDRDASFDPRLDSIVRVEARRLRQQLAIYYASEGRADPVMIELPKGSYTPRFIGRVIPLRTGAPARRAACLLRKLGLAVAVTVMAALLLWRAGIFRGVPAPHGWRLEGSRLVVLDARERVCWTHLFPPLNSDYDTFARDKVQIADIDGDGHAEVLFNLHPRSQGENSDSLLCFDRRGELRWEFRYGERKTFGARHFDASYAGRFFRVVRAGNQLRVLTVANHKIWFPAQIALVDPRTGRLVEEYWHPGSIYEIALQDLDGDGVEELLFGAINNPGDGLGHAGVGLLKLPFSRAPRPASYGAFPPVTGGGELAYVLLPLPDVCRAMGTLPIPGRFAVDQNRRLVVQTPLPEAGGMVYYLDFALNVIEHRFSDNFAAEHERYYRQHLLDHRLTPEETASLGKVASFAAAPDGNSPELARFWPYR